MIKKRLLAALAKDNRYIVQNVLFQWLSLLTQLVIVFVIAGLLGMAFEGNCSADYLVRSVVVLGLCLILRCVFDYMSGRSAVKAGLDVKRVLRGNLYDKMLRLGIHYKDKIATSEVVSISTEGVEQLETYYGRYLPQLFYSLLAPLTLFCALSPIDLKASVVLLVCVPLIPISIVVVQKIAKRLLDKYWSIYTGLGDSFLENLQGMTTLKIYQADERMAESMDKEADLFRKITMKVLTMQLNSTSVMDIMAYGGAAAGMIVAVYDYLNGAISFAGVVTIILLASEFFIPLRLLGSFFHIAMNGMAASDKLFAMMDLDEGEQGEKNLGELEEAEVSISGLTFAYDDRNVLEDISMEFKPHGMTAIVGESGCGKSTIAGIISGRHRGYDGSVLINGTQINEVDEKSIMRNITLVRSNSYLFAGTVLENLLMAKPSASLNELIDVLKKVNMWEYLEEQDGLNTKLSEKAGNLSGGQCQRLALARALLHDSAVYIFDEATSNVDIESEEQIMAVIKELARTKTVIVISHRLENVVEADCIYMMKSGRVVESGSHGELMENKGEYNSLYIAQKKLESIRQNRQEARTIYAVGRS